MRAFFEKFRRVDTLKNMDLKSVLNRSPIGSGSSVDSILASSFRTLHFPYQNNSSKIGFLARIHDGAPLTRILHVPNPLRRFSAMPKVDESLLQGTPAAMCDVPQRIKFKRLDKTAKNIMNILDKEAVEEVKTIREVPDIRPGYIIQLKVEVPENKRRVSIVKGIVIARRNAGVNTTFRLRRLVAGVGVESLFPLYSPNLKEIKVLEKKKVRRAKLYYLRDKMNALKKR